MENAKEKGKFNKIFKFFSLYETIWLFSIVSLSIVFAFVFPESDVNGVNGIIITILYVLDVVICVFCELLIAKQSRWGQFLYVVVDVLELIILILLNARFMSMAISVLFWLPVHVGSFVNWNNHKDDDNTQITEVRSLKWWQSLIMVLVCIVGTFAFGYLVASFDSGSDFYSSKTIEKIVAYFDACVGIVSVFDGLTMLFRYKETWLVWYIAVILETVINILSGQWILLILKVGYFTNTTYGYIKWTKYIKGQNAKTQENVDNLQIQVDTGA